MKVLIVLLFCTVAVTSEENCVSRDDCLHTQCCVKDYYGIEQTCQNLTDNGKTCNPQESLSSGVSKGICPCKPGYVCNFISKKCMPKERNALLQECKTADDCPDGKCCVTDFYNETQSCQPFTKSGELCFSNLTSKDKVFMEKCPCVTGYMCVNKASSPSSPYKCVEKPQVCKTAEDCPDGKCCVKGPNSETQYCQPFKKPDELCRPDLKSKDKVFIGQCPCQSGSFCLIGEFSRHHRCYKKLKNECDKSKDCGDPYKCCLMTGRLGERSCSYSNPHVYYCDISVDYDENKVYRNQCPCPKNFYCNLGNHGHLTCVYGSRGGP